MALRTRHNSKQLQTLTSILDKLGEPKLLARTDLLKVGGSDPDPEYTLTEKVTSTMQSDTLASIYECFVHKKRRAIPAKPPTPESVQAVSFDFSSQGGGLPTERKTVAMAFPFGDLYRNVRSFVVRMSFYAKGAKEAVVAECVITSFSAVLPLARRVSIEKVDIETLKCREVDGAIGRTSKELEVPKELIDTPKPESAVDHMAKIAHSIEGVASGDLDYDDLENNSGLGSATKAGGYFVLVDEPSAQKGEMYYAGHRNRVAMSLLGEMNQLALLALSTSDNISRILHEDAVVNRVVRSDGSREPRWVIIDKAGVKTVLEELLRRTPGQNFVLYGDDCRQYYGGKEGGIMPVHSKLEVVPPLTEADSFAVAEFSENRNASPHFSNIRAAVEECGGAVPEKSFADAYVVDNARVELAGRQTSTKAIGE